MADEMARRAKPIPWLMEGENCEGGVVGLMSCAGREMSSMERDEGGGGFVREWERQRGEA